MTRLIDVHAPQPDVAETLVLHVDATPAAILAAADRLAAREPSARVEALGATRDQRVFALSWHPRPEADGRVDVVWDLRVEPDVEGGSYLSSSRRFTASDARARAALLADWRTVGANADAIARRALRTIKRAAEAAPALTVVPHPLDAPLAA